MTSVYYSTVLQASIEDVWNEIRDFGAIAEWHPLIESCHIENEEFPDKVGCMRNFSLENGVKFREKILAMNDFKKTFSYSIEESPLPIENYVATMKLMPVTDGDGTFASWSSTFDCPPESKGELLTLVEKEVYQAGLDSLKNRVEE